MAGRDCEFKGKKPGIQESGGKGIGQRAERDYFEFRIANLEARSQEPGARIQELKAI
jgi:hypothetical protein